MLNAAKSFRLAFRRASIGKSPTDRKPEDDHCSHRDTASGREPSENQACENERDVELLYAKLRRVLDKPRFARLSAGTRARVLERLVKEEQPESTTVGYLHPVVRDRAQSTMVSERSLTYWDDQGEQPETVESETDVDDVVSVTASAAEAQPDEIVAVRTSYRMRSEQLGQLRVRQHQGPQSPESIVAVERSLDTDECASSVNRETLELSDATAQQTSNFPSISFGADAHSSQATEVVSQLSEAHQVDISSAIVAFRTAPLLEACTDEQLVKLFHSEGCLQRRVDCGDEIVLGDDDKGVMVIVVEGILSISRRPSSADGRSSAPSTSHKRPQILSAPASFASGTQDYDPTSERHVTILQADSFVSCLILSKSAVQERLIDLTELLGVQHLRSTCVPSSLRRFTSDFVQLLEANMHESDDLQLQLIKAESCEIDTDIVLSRMLRLVEDRLGGSCVALFVIDSCTDRMTRLQAIKGAPAITDSLPICGVAGLTARSQREFYVQEPFSDPRFVSEVDVSTGTPFVSTPITVKIPRTDHVKPAETVCALQFTTTRSDFAIQPSANERRVIEIAATRMCSFLRSQQSSRGGLLCSTTVVERFSISIASLRIPVSALSTVSASTTLIAIISMKLYHGEEELSPRTSIVSSRAMVDEDSGVAQFDFAERLSVNEGSLLRFKPLATRVVLEMSISSKSTTANSYLRRSSAMFQSFSNSMTTSTGVVTPRQHAVMSSSSVSMSQSLTEADDCFAQSDSTTTTASVPGRDTLLTGWSSFFLYGQHGEVRSGEFSLSLWTESKNIPAPIRQSGLEDPDSLSVLHLYLYLSESPSSSMGKAIPGTSINSDTSSVHQEEDFEGDHDEVTLASLKGRLLIDPFYRLTQEERKLLWRTKRHLPFDARMLPGLLLAVDWKNPHAVAEVYHLLEVVGVLDPPELALRLLGSKFPDPRVRDYAVRCLEALEAPQDVGLFMMQLVQALQHERFHDSSLARFLLRKALEFSATLGHQFYWLLKADMHQPKIRERYKALLHIYLTHISQSEREKLRHQHQVMRQLEDIHGQVAQCSTMEDKQSALTVALRKMDLPSEFVLPLDPSRKLCGLAINECRVLGSKKKPFYLVFKACDNSAERNDPCTSRTLHVLYKSGDDLRQDQLVLQLFSVMNRIWSRIRSSRQLQLVTYGCVSTGPKSGMIEVVRDAETIANIFSMKTERARGSQRGSTQHKFHSALSVLTEQDALTEWLMLYSLPPASVSQLRTFQKLHRSSLSERQIMAQANHSISRDAIIERLKDGGRDPMPYEDAVRNFATSCAASCIASYVLGIGDRHNDNIMVSRQGLLFHIDFGHIMGNFKKKFGVKRERTMFVFTPAFAAVLMSESDSRCHELAPQSETAKVEHRETDPDLAKKREMTFLKHLKHTGHSKSCHLEPPTTAEECQERHLVKNSTVIETPVDFGAPADRRQVWQRSIHASLRFSPRQTSKLNRDADPKRRDSTRQSQHVPAYELFTQLCCDGYNAVRHHVDLLYDLCVLMTCGSLPELQNESDLEWLREQLLLGETDDKASAHFLKLIKHSVVSRATLLNDAAHMLKHG